jgi:hypothetical protein
MPSPKLSLAARAVATGGRAVEGGYVTSAGTFMRNSGIRMTAAQARKAAGLPAFPKPTSGPGSGETTTTKRAPSELAPVKAEGIKDAKSAAAPLTAEELKLAKENGIETSFVGKARELLGNIKGKTYAKLGAGGAAAATATTVAVKGTPSETAITDNMTSDQIAETLVNQPAVAEDARAGGATNAVNRLVAYQERKQEDATDLGSLQRNAALQKAESDLARAQLHVYVERANSNIR